MVMMGRSVKRTLHPCSLQLILQMLYICKKSLHFSLLLLEQILVYSFTIRTRSRFQLIFQLFVTVFEFLYLFLNSLGLLLLIGQFSLESFYLLLSLFVLNIDIPAILLMQSLHILLPHTPLLLQIQLQTLITYSQNVVPLNLSNQSRFKILNYQRMHELLLLNNHNPLLI